MRILVATDQWFPDLRGGSARVATETARRLAARGHDVVALAPASPASHGPAIEAEGNLTVLRVLPRGRLPITVTDVLATWKHARRQPDSFDVVLAHQSTTGLGASLGRDLPLVLVVHALATRELRFDRASASAATRAQKTLLYPILRGVERRSLARAHRLLVLSGFTRSLLEESTAVDLGRVIEVAGGVDTEVFSPSPDRDATRRGLGVDPAVPLLLTVRRLEPRMGLENLLRALPLLGPDGPLLAIAGSGQLDGSLRRIAKELRVDTRVRFLGRVDDGPLIEWYRAADAFVLPTVAYEGFGMVTAEALACGTPVVGTPIGATPELLRPLDAGLVSSGADPASLAIAIEDVLRRADPALRARCQAHALARFSWDRVMIRWEAALEEAIASSERTRARTVHRSAREEAA